MRYAGNTHRFGNVEELGDGVNFNKQIKLVTEKERSFPKVFAAAEVEDIVFCCVYIQALEGNVLGKEVLDLRIGRSFCTWDGMVRRFTVELIRGWTLQCGTGRDLRVPFVDISEVCLRAQLIYKEESDRTGDGGRID